jgi:hypothetical protein
MFFFYLKVDPGNQLGSVKSTDTILWNIFTTMVKGETLTGNRLEKHYKNKLNIFRTIKALI